MCTHSLFSRVSSTQPSPCQRCGKVFYRKKSKVWCDHPNRFSEVLPWFFRRYSGKGGILFFCCFRYSPPGGLRDHHLHAGATNIQTGKASKAVMAYIVAYYTQYSTVQYSTVHFFQGIFSPPLFFRAKMPFLARFNQYKPVVTSLSQICGHFPLVTETENNKKKSIPPSSSPRFLRGSSVGSPYPLNHTKSAREIFVTIWCYDPLIFDPGFSGVFTGKIRMVVVVTI